MPGGFSYLGNFKCTDSTGEIVSSSVGSSSLLSSCADSVTIEVDSSTGKLQIPDHGTNAAGGVQRDKMSKGAGFWLSGTIDKTGTSAGGAFKLQNTYSSVLVIDRVIIYVAAAEASAGTCTLNVGTDDDGATDTDNLIEDLDMTTAAPFSSDNLENSDGEHNGKTTAIWPDDEFVVGTLSDAGTELTAYYGVHVIELTGE